MEKIRTKEEIELFSIQFKALMQGRQLPENVKLTVDLETPDFNNLIPEEYREWKELEYNTNSGIRVFPVETNE